MEEQKNNEVKMTPNTESQEQPQKYTYEELTKIANDLFNDNRYLKHQLQQAGEYIQTIDRLEHLLKVVEIANSNNTYSFSNDFVSKCISDIENTMLSFMEKKQSDKEN